ncbi:MAG: hypothetical protein ACI4EQ_06340 [Lachnospiraceae bacterium]
MRKRILCVLTILFFGSMLFGTFFHQKIDGIFRESVQIASIETYNEEHKEIIEINGTETEVTMKETFLLLSKEAVREGMIYVLETVEVPYGSYEVVRLKSVQTAGEKDSMVKIQDGLSETDRVVAVFSDTLSDGMRVAVR